MNSGRLASASAIWPGRVARIAAVLISSPAILRMRSCRKAVGPDYTLNNKKSEQARVWIHSWLEGIAADQDKLILTIEHTPTVFSSGLGEEVNRYYFGREATSTGPAGGRNKVTVAWKVVTTERQEKGKGTITAVYTLLPDKTLLVVWRMEHDSLLQPLEVRLAFERVAR